MIDEIELLMKVQWLEQDVSIPLSTMPTLVNIISFWIIMDMETQMVKIMQHHNITGKTM